MVSSLEMWVLIIILVLLLILMGISFMTSLYLKLRKS